MRAFNHFTDLLKSCPTKDHIAIVEKVDQGTKWDRKKSVFEYWQNTEVHDVIMIWNHDTKRLSSKIIKENTKGKYFKASGKTFYLKDFKLPGSGSIIQDIQEAIHNHMTKYGRHERRDHLELLLNEQTYYQLIDELQRRHYCNHPIVGFEMFGVKVKRCTNTYLKIQVVSVWEH